MTLGFADLEGLTTAATLTFAAKEDAPNRTDVTYTYLQQEEKTGTAEKPVDIRTETLELHCPSKAFTDLNTNQWYHEGVDYVLEQELMIGHEQHPVCAQWNHDQGPADDGSAPDGWGAGDEGAVALRRCEGREVLHRAHCLGI